MSQLRRIAGAVLRRIQCLALYRKLGQRFAARVTIREATDADKVDVRRWLNPQGDPTPHQNPGVTDWVAYRRGHLAGFVQLVRHPPEHFPYTGHWLFGLVVKSRQQGFGIGERLSLAVIARSLEEGAPALSLLVDDNNARAIRLYRKLGFEFCVIPELEAQLERERKPSGSRRVVMRKPLAGPE
jgi:ribosomal protein S18 acetylase RimI-like enzyme